MDDLEFKFDRIDYTQVGLTSANTLKAIDFNSDILVCVGDYTGSVNCFLINMSDITLFDILFKTLPNANSKINCVEFFSDHTNSPKMLISFGSSIIRGYTKKGKQFFGLEINNLTEPIRNLKIKWCSDIFVSGEFTFNHYTINSENQLSKSFMVENKSFYLSPDKINCLIVLNEEINNKTVAILACNDRLIRVLMDSVCEFEIETCGICNVIVQIADFNLYLNQTSTKPSESNIFYFCYGTLNGRLSLLKINFSTWPLEINHCWEINLEQSNSAIQCISPTISFSLCKENIEFNTKQASELFVGRSDGSFELFIFDLILDKDANELIDIERKPKLVYETNCEERLTSIAICKLGKIIICCTFTGLIFSFVRDFKLFKNNNPFINKSANIELINESILAKDTALKIEELELECEALEQKLIKERENYQKLTSNSKTSNEINHETRISALPYFTINSYFVLQDNAIYMLTIECEAPIDCVIFQSEISLDFYDCERNSSIISFNDNQHSTFSNSNVQDEGSINNQFLATFRCQTNTTRLEFKLTSIEGQFSELRIYILTRVTPKSCQVKYFNIKALSLHKRKYFTSEKEILNLNNQNVKITTINEESCLKKFYKLSNKLIITGKFSLNEAYKWLYSALPEIPRKLNSLNSNDNFKFYFQSTLIGSFLIVELFEGKLFFESDNVSTISILKDFLTKMASKTILIELKLDLNRSSLNHILEILYPKLIYLIKHKINEKLKKAISDLINTDSEIAKKMLNEIEQSEQEFKDFNIKISEDINQLDRYYGIIADLFIDYKKLKNNNLNIMINTFKNKINEMITLIENSIKNNDKIDKFVECLVNFWEIKN